MSRMFWSATLLALANGCFGGNAESNCGAGEIMSRDDGACRAVCATNADCEGEEFCDGEVCRSGVGDAAPDSSANPPVPTSSEPNADPETDDAAADPADVGEPGRPTADADANPNAEEDEPVSSEPNASAPPVDQPVSGNDGHEDDDTPAEEEDHPTPDATEPEEEEEPVVTPEPEPVPDPEPAPDLTPAPAPAPACAQDLASITKLGPKSENLGLGVFGCPGQWKWANRAAACAPGWRVCSASDWTSKAVSAPTHHYWTDSNLGWCDGNSCSSSNDPIVVGTGAFALPPPGSGTGYVPPADQSPACMASTDADHGCGSNPMRVCWPGAKTYPGTNVVDGSGNVCNWTGCDLEGGAGTFSGYFGGCFGNETAGTLCCKDIVFEAWVIE